MFSRLHIAELVDSIVGEAAERQSVRLTHRYNSYTILLRFKFDPRKSDALRANPKRGIGFEEATALWEHPYHLDQRIDAPEQFRAIGWVRDTLYSVIFEVREDEDGEFFHLVTLWKATRVERMLYEENS